MKHPKEYIIDSKHGESLKSRMIVDCWSAIFAGDRFDVLGLFQSNGLSACFIRKTVGIPSTS